jgi:hypothetical protein
MGRHRTWAGLLLVALVALVGEAACGPLHVQGDLGAREKGAQQSTVNSIVCRGDESELAGYFVASGTPDKRRIEMRDNALREQAAGKCGGSK